jgi:hypothetical protein
MPTGPTVMVTMTAMAAEKTHVRAAAASSGPEALRGTEEFLRKTPVAVKRVMSHKKPPDFDITKLSIFDISKIVNLDIS